MFQTLELQYLNKLVEGEVRDFASPKPFHTLKIQRLGNDGIKPFAQVCSTLVVPISALVRDVPVESCELTDTSPPIVRTFDLTAQCLTEGSEFFQGLFQELWRVYLLTGAERQIGIQTEIYPYALTCSKIGFSRGVVCDDIEPVSANRIAKDLDIPDSSVPLAVLMEREPAFVEFKGLRGFIPRFERQSDTPFLKKVRRLELRRTVAIFAFELRQSTKTVKKSVISDVDTDDHFVKRVAGYPCPMLVSSFEQLRQMRLQAKPASVFTIDTVIPFFQCQEVVVDIAKVVKHIAQAHIFRMFAYLIFIRSASTFLFSLSLFFHWISRITILSPTEWEADTPPGSPPVTGKGAVTLCMSANVIHLLNHNSLRLSSVFSKKRYGLTHEGGLSSPT